MPTITFFRQARRDGGIRTGIDIENQTVLSRFEGSEDDDPTLLWFVDVRCTGTRLPRDAEAARLWLERTEKPIVAAIESLAKQIPTGLDPSESPLRSTRRLSNGGSITVACSAIRRAEARALAAILDDVAANWRGRLRSLRMTQAA